MRMFARASHGALNFRCFSFALGLVCLIASGAIAVDAWADASLPAGTPHGVSTQGNRVVTAYETNGPVGATGTYVVLLAQSTEAEDKSIHLVMTFTGPNGKEEDHAGSGTASVSGQWKGRLGAKAPAWATGVKWVVYFDKNETTNTWGIEGSISL